MSGALSDGSWGESFCASSQLLVFFSTRALGIPACRSIALISASVITRYLLCVQSGLSLLEEFWIKDPLYTSVTL